MAKREDDERPTEAGAKRIIKRYPNRKLYDAQERAFTSLRGVERMIRRGFEVQVIDNATGEDITEDTLAQVLRSRRRGDADVLSAMIRTPGRIAQAIAGEEDQAEEIRLLREQVRQLTETIDAILADDETPPRRSDSGKRPASRAKRAGGGS